MSDEIDDKDGDEPVPPKTKAPATPPQDDTGNLSIEEALEQLRKTQKALKQANAEAQANREAKRRLKDLEDEDERRQQASLSEVERERKRADAAEKASREAEQKASKLEEKLIRAQIDRDVEDEARKLGVRYPRMVSEMLRGRDSNGIDWDRDLGRSVGVKEAVKKLLVDYPDLPTGQPVQRGQGTPPREAVGRHSPTPADKAAAEQAGLMGNSRIGYSAF